MTYQRSEIRDLVRRRLGDLTSPYKWSDLQLNQWINDAIADISNTIPRVIEYTITTTAGVLEYDLPDDFLDMIRVEYPTGESPKSYLIQANHEGFSGQDGYYDIFARDDRTVASLFIMSESPGSSEDVLIQYNGAHAYLDDDTDECTILDTDLELIMLYVRWATLQELSTTEAADPDPSGLSISTLELNAYRAERAYRTSLKDHNKAGKSVLVSWDNSRIY